MVLMIVSGRSGSGKSVALRALEDMGFYCVDNLPVVLLPDLARTLADREISAAVSIDVRNMPESPEIFEQAMSNLPDAFSPQLLFLDADRNTLIRRYSDTPTASAFQQKPVAGKCYRQRKRFAGASAFASGSDCRYLRNVRSRAGRNAAYPSAG